MTLTTMARRFRGRGVASGSSVPTAYRYDDFSTYANDAAFKANQGSLGSGATYATTTTDDSSLTLSTSVTHEGHNTLRVRIWESSTTSPNLDANSDSIDDVWVRWVQKWSPGWSNAVRTGYGGAKAHKLFNFNFVSLNGRILGTLTNGTGTPGASSGNNAELQVETVSKTGANTFITPALRNAISGGSSLFHDDKWYEFVVHFKVEDTNTVRANIWFQEYGQTRTLLCTLRCNDLDQAATTGLTPFRFFDTFNSNDAGAPDAGVDQSIYLSRWDIWKESLTPDPLSLGSNVGANVSLAGALDNASVSVSRGGASATRTLTVTRGSDITTSPVSLYGPSVGLPSGLTVSCSGSPLSSGSSTSTVTITAAGGTTPGTYALNITCVADGVTGVGAATDSVPISITVT